MDITNIIFPVITLGGLGVVFGLGLGYAGMKFKVEEDERVPQVRGVLPGANCGGCGFAGCDAFAAAVVSGAAKPNGCPVGGAAVTKAVSEIMGVEAVIKEKEVAFVKCAGDCETAQSRYEYQGIEDCSAQSQLAAGGSKLCGYGCLGSGSCVRACEYDAISIVNGIALVDPEKCSACGKCTTVCPRKLIELVPYRNDVRVVCNSKDNGKVTRANCKVGCIGCKMCQKACEYEAIVMDGALLAKVDYEKCTQCNKCTEKCPTKAVKNLKG